MSNLDTCPRRPNPIPPPQGGPPHPTAAAAGWLQLLPSRGTATAGTATAGTGTAGGTRAGTTAAGSRLPSRPVSPRRHLPHGPGGDLMAAIMVRGVAWRGVAGRGGACLEVQSWQPRMHIAILLSFTLSELLCCLVLLIRFHRNSVLCQWRILAHTQSLRFVSLCSNTISNLRCIPNAHRSWRLSRAAAASYGPRWRRSWRGWGWLAARQSWRRGRRRRWRWWWRAAAEEVADLVGVVVVEEEAGGWRWWLG